MTKSLYDLDLFQEIHQLTIELLKTAGLLPTREQYVLTDQLRRAAISIAANFAEGFRKATIKDKLRMYNIALCSLEECRYYLLLAKDLYDLQKPELAVRLDTVGKRIYSYSKAIRANHNL